MYVAMHASSRGEGGLDLVQVARVCTYENRRDEKVEFGIEMVGGRVCGEGIGNEKIT